MTFQRIIRAHREGRLSLRVYSKWQNKNMKFKLKSQKLKVNSKVKI